jgi:HAMP domain-containing protein
MPEHKPPKKGPQMATTPGVKNKSVTESFLDEFEGMIGERAKEMTDEEFKAAEKEFNKVVDRVKDRVSRREKRGTA